MRRTTLEFVRDIVEAMEKAQRFTNGMDYSDFAGDERTIFAVARALEIVGEATKNVPDNTRKRFPQVPWRLMAGMRDVLIHGYFDIDVEVLWKTATERVSQVMPVVQSCLNELEEQDSGV